MHSRYKHNVGIDQWEGVLGPVIMARLQSNTSRCMLSDRRRRGGGVSQVTVNGSTVRPSNHYYRLSLSKLCNELLLTLRRTLGFCQHRPTCFTVFAIAAIVYDYLTD